MTDIDRIALRHLDMTMLLVFSEAMRLRKLTLVAARLGLTQSAISHTVGRLREAFGDPLFLRKPYGIEPTARARELGPRIAALLADAQDLLSAAEPFDPATTKRRIRIATLDHHAAMLGPALCRVFEKEAPGLDVLLRSAVRREAFDHLDNDDADLAIGFLTPVSSRHLVRRLHEEGYAVVARRGLKTFDGTLDTYLSARHILVSPSGEPFGIVDAALQAKGLSRRVAAVFPLFLPALAAVAETRMIATVPKRLAEANAARFGLRLFKPPLPLRSFPVNALWHRRNEKDACIAWVVGKLVAMASSRSD